MYIGRNLNALLLCIQFVNKLIYAREGAKDMMDRSCSDLPWHVSLEVDGKNIEIPEVAFFASFVCHNFVIYLWRIFSYLVFSSGCRRCDCNEYP
jgi:hypothetical protein